MTDGAVDLLTSLSLAGPAQLGSTGCSVSGTPSGEAHSGSFFPPAYRDVRDAGIIYRFLNQPVCAVCGEQGHLASICSTPLCSLCDKYGHASGCCSDACSNCGKQHVLLKGKRCKAAACRHCSRFGHVAEHCPNAECMRCGYRGHMMSKCPLPAADVVSYASAYGSLGVHTVMRPGAALSDGGQSLTDTLLASQYSGNDKAGNKVAKPSSGGEVATGAKRLQLAAKLLALPITQPPALELLPPATTAAEDKERSSKLVYALFAEHADYVTELVQDQNKLVCLSRIRPSDLDGIIANAHSEQILDAIYQQQLLLQQEEEHQQQLELEQLLEREQYEQRQQTIEHQRQREQQSRQQRYQRQHTRLQGQHHHHSCNQAQPRQQSGPHQVQKQGHCSPALPNQKQPYRPQHPRDQQHRQGPPLNVLDNTLSKGGRVGNVLVCLVCGAKGHQLNQCRTPYCSECCKYGHPAGACKSACLRCGWRHGPPDDKDCLVQQCGKCELFGHMACECPVPRCCHCGHYGHVSDDCGSIASCEKVVAHQGKLQIAAGSVLFGKVTESDVVGGNNMPYKPLQASITAAPSTSP